MGMGVSSSARRGKRSRRAAMAEINRAGLIYLNRLSDLLFVMARVVNARAGIPETEW